MPLFIGIHGSSSCSFVNNGGHQLQLIFNNGGCQPLTFGMGAHGWCSSSCSCCICQWTVPSIDDCCTLMATILTITSFAIYVGNCPLASSAHACILQLFQAYHSESVFDQVYRYLPNLSITRVTQAPFCSLQRVTSTRWFVTSHPKSVNACLWDTAFPFKHINHAWPGMIYQALHQGLQHPLKRIFPSATVIEYFNVITSSPLFQESTHPGVASALCSTLGTVATQILTHVLIKNF